VCDRCGGALLQREDDREETIRKRLAVYREQTAPLVAYYRGRGLLKEVDGRGDVSEVFARICRLLDAEG
jgi:adenylate kinase